MNKQAFINGFVKRAQQHGLTEEQAGIVLQKDASDESSWLGRWLASTALNSETHLNSPYKSLGAQLPGMVVPFGSIAAAPIANRLVHGDHEGREDRINKQRKKVEDSGYGEHMLDSAKRMGIPIASIMAGLGGAAGAAGMFSGRNLPFGANVDEHPITAALMGVGLGGLTGLLSGGAAGAMSGGINKLILNNTTKETKDRSANVLADNTVSSGLPFGAMINAMRGRDGKF